MTSTPELNISGSPIYENLVATSGDPYQPPAYQLPALFQPPDAAGAGYGAQDAAGYGAGYGVPADGYGSPAMLSQFLSQIFGDGQNWVAVVVFGGPMAEQLRQAQQFAPPFAQYQQFQQAQQFAQPQMPQPFESGAPGGYADASDQAAMAQAYQAYQQMMMYQWVAQQQAMQQQQAMTAGQQPLALTSGPATQPADVALPALPLPPDPAGQAAAGFGGMLTEDWAGWLGQTSQSARPQPAALDEYEDYQEDRYEPSYERRGGRLSSRLGAAMRELRGR